MKDTSPEYPLTMRPVVRLDHDVWRYQVCLPDSDEQTFITIADLSFDHQRLPEWRISREKDGSSVSSAIRWDGQFHPTAEAALATLKRNFQ